MLELSKVTEQVEDISRALAARDRQREEILPEARKLRKRYAQALEQLSVLAEAPEGRKAKCAAPTHEPLDAALPAPQPPREATVVGADGSQIYPDPHGWAHYYLINVGSLIYRHGSGQAPVANSEPRVSQAVDGEGNLLTSERIDARRDVAEMQRLADLVESEPGDAPVVALLDSTLGLRDRSNVIPQAEQAALLQSYEAQVGRIRRAGAALAGFLSRSRRAGIVSLLDLAQVLESGGARSGPSPFLGLNDPILWGDLRPGERSALLVEVCEPPVYFFYLNPEPPDAPPLIGAEIEAARVEVPNWVALEPRKLNWVHGLVYEQCCLNNGYPYVLTRADELAIILNDEREALEAMLLQAMGRQGLSLPQVSPKERQKRVARAPFRRRP